MCSILIGTIHYLPSQILCLSWLYRAAERIAPQVEFTGILALYFYI